MKTTKLNYMKLSVGFIFLCLMATIILGSCSSNDEDTVTVAVTGVTLNKSTLSLTISSTESLTATINPTTATTSTVSWSSSNTSIATVSNGTVTAIAEGNATITVTTSDGGYTATCAVTVTSSSSSSSDTYSQSSGTVSLSGKTYSSATSDVNAVKVSGGSLTLTNCTLAKTGGDTGNSDNSSFYGINAALLASGTGSVTMPVTTHFKS